MKITSQWYKSEASSRHTRLREFIGLRELTEDVKTHQAYLDSVTTLYNSEYEGGGFSFSEIEYIDGGPCLALTLCYKNHPVYYVRTWLHSDRYEALDPRYVVFDMREKTVNSWHEYPEDALTQTNKALEAVAIDESDEALNPWAVNTGDGFPPFAGEVCETLDTDETPQSTTALDAQVGGNHYKGFKIQPVEYIMENEIPFMEGNVVKYVSRWRDKGGVEDLKKARHYLDMLIEYEEREDR